MIYRLMLVVIIAIAFSCVAMTPEKFPPFSLEKNCIAELHASKECSNWQYVRLGILSLFIRQICISFCDVVQGKSSSQTFIELAAAATGLTLFYKWCWIEYQVIDAVKRNNTMETQVLYYLDCFPSLSEYTKRKVISYAALNGNEELLRYLFSKKQYDPRMWHNHPSPLRIALAHEKIKAAEVILEFDPNSFYETYNGRRLLHSMALLGKLKSVEWLKGKIAEVGEERRIAKQSMLEYIQIKDPEPYKELEQSHPNIIKALSLYNPYIDICNGVGDPCLMAAIKSTQNPVLIRALIKLKPCGAQTTIPNSKTGELPHQLAGRIGNPNLAQTIEHYHFKKRPPLPREVKEASRIQARELLLSQRNKKKEDERKKEEELAASQSPRQNPLSRMSSSLASLIPFKPKSAPEEKPA